MDKPKIRFKGYTEAWEQRKLGDAAIKIGSGKTPSGGNNVYVDSGIMLIRSQNINYDKVNLSDAVFIDAKTDLLMKNSQVYKNDVLLNITGASIGRSAVYKGLEHANVNQHVCIIRPMEGYFSEFIQLNLTSNNGQRQIESSQAGGGREGLNFQQIGKMCFMFPSMAEQTKIGEYFSALDHLITLHQRKCDETKKLKKYMLQKMFPKNGANVPEIRFDGFTDAWEQRKLSEVYQNIGNAFVGTATPYYVEEGHFYLESNNVKDGQINHNTEIFINDEFYKRQKDKWLHTGDMVMVQSGHVGHAAVISEEMDNTAAHALIMFRNPKISIEPYFLNYQYQTDKSKKKIENITTGNTIKHILASDMQNFIVDIPNYAEQGKIAQYFRHLDHLITLHQHKCEELQNIKKFMMQNMFV